jgi:hypothetical protein
LIFTNYHRLVLVTYPVNYTEEPKKLYLVWNS